MKKAARTFEAKPVPYGDEEGEYTPEFRASLIRARADLKKDRVVSHAEIKKRLSF